MAKLVDAPDLGSGAARCVGSSPSSRTIYRFITISVGVSPSGKAPGLGSGEDSTGGEGKEGRRTAQKEKRTKKQTRERERKRQKAEQNRKAKRED